MRTLLLCLLLSLLSTPAGAALQVFACEPEWAALAEELGGERVAVYAATTAQQDVHRIQPRPSLIARYRQAELVICTGADLEAGWLPALEQKANNPRVRTGQPGFFEAARHVELLNVPQRVDRSQGDVHPYGNPHIHTDPRNILRVAEALSLRLGELDAAGAEHYRARVQDFRSRWQAALRRWETAAAPLRGLPVVSRHGSWLYLYDWLGLKEVATLEPKPGIPPSAGYLESLVALLRERPARLLIFAAYEDRRPVDWLVRRSDIRPVELPYTVGGADGADSLFAVFDITVQRLVQAAAAGVGQRDS